MKNPYIIGSLCYLRVPEEVDCETNWNEWFSDPITSKFLVDRFWPNSKADQLNFVRSLVGDRNRLVLLVCNLNSDFPIGVVSLDKINFVHRCANFALVIPKFDGCDSRISYEASRLILEVAFNKLNLKNIRTFTASENKPSIMLQKLLGFNEVGKFSKIFEIDNELNDEICMQLDVSRWRKGRSNI
jgi:RimJ/RimL family protein N-acetyltransferase